MNDALIIKVKNKLKEIYNPLTNRDIISDNILKSVEIKNDVIILILEIEKSKVHLKHTEEFSIGNIEKLSKEINFKRLDVHKKNFDLVRPYKLIEDSNPVIVLGFGK